MRRICQETTMERAGKRKRESSPWVKGKKMPGPTCTKAEKDSINEAKKCNLAASDEGPGITSHSRRHSLQLRTRQEKEIGASRLKVHSSSIQKRRITYP